MRAFACEQCRELLLFEDDACRHCGAPAGFDPSERRMVTLRKAGSRGIWVPDTAAAAVQDLGPVPGGHTNGAGPGRANGRCYPADEYRLARCGRAHLARCNWLVPADRAGEACASCRLTRTLPHRRDTKQGMAFAKAEASKRRLVFQLGELGLPLIGRDEDPERGLAFELLSKSEHVVTGHDRGVITLDLNETDDAFREQARLQLGEPYRTLLGHFRHEIGHYYWPLLVVRPGHVEEARALFGDERADYNEALQRHYRQGPVTGWGDEHVSAYATMHPFEDWAETFAHYLHILDTVQTAASYGVLVVGPVDDRTGRRDPANASVPSEDTASLEGFGAVIADWLPLTFALNALNRSMGKDDLYPFDLPERVVAKLTFVHERITEAAFAPQP
jgi:hypothetical protein